MQGTVLQGIGGFYTAMDEAGSCYVLRAQRKLRRDKSPKVGDHVEMMPGTGEEDGWLQAVLARTNELERPPVANIDQIVLVASAAFPEPDLGMIDKMLAQARRHGIEPVLVVTKMELNPDSARKILDQYAGANIRTLAVSAVTGENLDALRGILAGTVHALAGQSGAGKSTLINALYHMELETGELSEKVDRGKNTTRRCQLIPVENGGMVLDTPGFSLLELELFDPVELKDTYPEFAPYEGKCYFQPCYHAKEPRCAVRTAVEEGKIDARRHKRYFEILEEQKIRWRDRYD